MKYLLLLMGLWIGTAGRPAQQPGPRKPYPHFRPPEKRKRKLKHYKPKTWRERAPEPKVPAVVPAP